GDGVGVTTIGVGDGLGVATALIVGVGLAWIEAPASGECAEPHAVNIRTTARTAVLMQALTPTRGLRYARPQDCLQWIGFARSEHRTQLSAPGSQTEVVDSTACPTLSFDC